MTFNEERFKKARAALRLLQAWSEDEVPVFWETANSGWKLKVWGLEFVALSMDECVEQLVGHLSGMAKHKVADAREALARAEAGMRAVEDALR